MLTSISSDGKVNQWSMKKGLVPHTIMELKRIPNLSQLQGHQMQGVSREASGMCFDSVKIGPQYFVGTEDGRWRSRRAMLVSGASMLCVTSLGLLHKCSTSYNRQTLENYYGHTGPVYKVRVAFAMLSCGLNSSFAWRRCAARP